MNDIDLKEHLLTTCPVRPGQEERAWAVLRTRFAAPPASFRGSIFSSPWRLATCCALVLLAIGAVFERPSHHGFALANSQVPGIYATSFYSHSAKAQVVWLNGMDPATDKPTYLDPSSPVPAETPGNNPDRL